MRAVKKVSNGAQAINFENMIPKNEVWSKIVGIRIAAHSAERNELRRARRASLCSESFLAKKLARFDEILQKLNEERSNAQNDPLSMQVSRIKKLTNQLKKVADAIEKEEKDVPFGEKSHSLIFCISSLVIREISELCASQPKLAYEYLTGKQRYYWFTTYTQSLCTSLYRNSLSWAQINATTEEKRQDKDFLSRTSSFRGRTGLYASLSDAGFIVEKVGTGNKVRLRIDLDWIMGFSLNVLENLPTPAPVLENNLAPSIAPLFDPLTRGNSSHFSQIDKSKETEYKESGLASPDLSIPTVVGEKIEENEAKSTPPSDKTKFSDRNFEENCAAPREISAKEADEIALDVANDSTKRLLKAIFNQQNLKNGKVRFNSTSVCEEISLQDVKDCRFWMLDTLRALKLDTEGWTDIAALVNEAISNTEKYLAEHPTRWIYHPKFYLSTSFSTGTLKTYVETFLRERSYEPSEAPQYSSPHTPQVAWLIENGANRESVMRYVRRFGEDVVSHAVAFAGARMAGEDGFKPVKGKVPYIMGILANLNPALIAEQAALEKARYQEKLVAKTLEQSDAWTTKKVEALVRNMVKSQIGLQRCSSDVCAAIAARANEKTANRPQVETWITGVAEGTSRLFITSNNTQ